MDLKLRQRSRLHKVELPRLCQKRTEESPSEGREKGMRAARKNLK